MSKYETKMATVLMTILFLASIVVIPVQAYNGGNLVINGSFENPVVTHSKKWDIFDSGTDGLGWMVEWADDYTGAPETAKLELHRMANGWSSYDGEQHTELDTDWDGPNENPLYEQASVKIYQDLKTKPGKPYTLSYAWSPRPNHADNKLEVWWDGVKISNYSGSGGSNTTWTLETKLVYASVSTTRLEFVEVGTPDELGMFLDAVSIVRAQQSLNCEIEIELDWGPPVQWLGNITGDIEGTFTITPDPVPSFPGSTEHFLETWVIKPTIGGEIRLYQEGVWNLKTGKWKSNGMVTAATGGWEYLIGANMHVSGTTTEFLGPPHPIYGTGTMTISGLR